MTSAPIVLDEAHLRRKGFKPAKKTEGHSPRVLRWRHKDGHRDYWAFEATYLGVARTEPAEEHAWLFKYACDIADYPKMAAIVDGTVQFDGEFRAETPGTHPSLCDFLQQLMGRLTGTFLDACAHCNHPYGLKETPPC